MGCTTRSTLRYYFLQKKSGVLNQKKETLLMSVPLKLISGQQNDLLLHQLLLIARHIQEHFFLHPERFIQIFLISVKELNEFIFLISHCATKEISVYQTIATLKNRLNKSQKRSIKLDKPLSVKKQTFHSSRK